MPSAAAAFMTQWKSKIGVVSGVISATESESDPFHFFLLCFRLTFRLWSSENQMVAVGSRRGRINQSKCTFPRFVIGLVLPLLLPILTIRFSLDHKRNVSDGVVSGIGTRFSLDYKVYASYYDSDSDSVASENQPLVAHTKARCVWLVVEGVAWGAKRSQSRIKPNVTKMDQSPATIPAV